MITIAHGNLLKANVEALVNTVNTEGVMGKGIALQFKRAYPAVYDAYEADCRDELVQIGAVHVVDLGGLGGGPNWVINFPTKRHWRAKSKLEDIKTGLVDLVAKVRALGIKSIALPPLGCGHGGLNWSDVLPLIREAFKDLPDVDVQVYPPTGTPDPVDMPNKTKKPPITASSAAVVALASQYREGQMDPVVRLLEIHKMMYFLQEAGEPLRLNYVAHNYGPYASNLRHVLGRIEGHLITGYGDGHDGPGKEIDILPGALDEAMAFLDGRFDTKDRMERVAELIAGYEDPYGLELLSTVHWVMCHSEGAAESAESAIDAIHSWNERKAIAMKPEHIRGAWARLKSMRWDSESRSGPRRQVVERGA
ncbi:macro domain-containing protein [Arenimonas sp.]|uniref:type II toxin-antitoxin system antitoxin DNA ADP-ribosyl glycohydrolase DarG n=1 Tax=Arenimonas sp. TaxID=1872635 RepID=UPI0039E4DA77